jgi:hypothetical protein
MLRKRADGPSAFFGTGRHCRKFGRRHNRKVIQKLRVGAHDSDRASSYFRLRLSRAVLILFLVCSSVCISDLHAQPVTSAYGSIGVWGPSGGTSQSNATLVDWSGSGDFSSGSPYWYSRARSQTSFGLNSAYATSGCNYSTADYPFTPNPTLTASYLLSWSTLDHSSSGNILNISLSSSNSFSLPLSNSVSTSGLHLGSFQFQYGTPYIIQSSLTVRASTDAVGYGLAKSVWSDTFTFQGQPQGTSGIAGFDVDLSGSFSSIATNSPPYHTWPTYPGVRELLTADFSNGASLDYIFLPTGASLTADPGFPGIVTTPEPSAAALLSLGGCRLLLRRRC